MRIQRRALLWKVSVLPVRGSDLLTDINKVLSDFEDLILLKDEDKLL